MLPVGRSKESIFVYVFGRLSVDFLAGEGWRAELPCLVNDAHHRYEQTWAIKHEVRHQGVKNRAAQSRNCAISWSQKQVPNLVPEMGTSFGPYSIFNRGAEVVPISGTKFGSRNGDHFLRFLVIEIWFLVPEIFGKGQPLVGGKYSPGLG